MSAARPAPLPTLRSRWPELLAVFACTSGGAVLLSLPLALVVGGLWGDRPEGDLALFQPGGFFLLETARLLQRDLSALALGSPAWLLLGSYLLLLPWTALAVSLCQPVRRKPWQLAALSLERLPALTLVFGASLLLRASVLLLGVLLVDVIARGVAPGPDERVETFAQLGALALTAALLLLVGLLHDLSTAAAARHLSSGVSAMISALATLREQLPRAAWRWGLRALPGALLVALAGALAGLFGVATGARLALVTLVHQATLLALVALRASWLREALALVGPRGDGWPEGAEDAPPAPESPLRSLGEPPGGDEQG